MFGRRKIPYISQLGTMDCGAACLAMILNYYGLKVDIVDISASIHTGRDGMSLKAMRQAVQDFGFSFSALKYNYVEENLKSTLPVILCTENHYVVIEKHTYKGKYVVIDPTKGRYLTEFDVLQETYKDILISITPNYPIKKLEKKRLKIKISKTKLVTIFVLMLLLQLITLCVPIIVQHVIDGLSTGIKLDVIRIILAILIIIGSYFSVAWLRQCLVLDLNMNIYQDSLSKMINKLFKIDINFFEWHSAGDIGNRFNSMDQLYVLVTNVFIGIIIECITSIICLVAMLQMSRVLTLYTVFLALIQISVMLVINKKNKLETKEYMYIQSNLQGELVDTLGNIIEIKCMGMDDAVARNLRDKYSKLIRSFKQRSRTNNLMDCLISTISLIFPLAIYLMGSISISNGNISIGQLIAFVTLVSYFTAPFNSLIMIFPSLNSIREILLRYKELLNFRDNEREGELLPDSFESVHLENVTYSYNKMNNDVIKNTSLHIKKGEKISIVGLSGSGKSTLVKIMLGALQVEKGRIYINDIDINKIAREQIYNWFSVVTQNPMCLNSSIRRNVDITNSYSDSDIYKALEIAEILEDVNAMPLGLDTIIGDAGQNISGGQRQRIAIARALLNNTEVIIFDEATSNLDPITEKNIYNNLKKSNKTQIIITHRLASVQDSDQIYVMDRGEVIESGTHESLINDKGWYFRSTMNSQI
ncbi:MAG: peptidase domain-containing ABC transporter [Anaerocolumna aminovalerica]|uniref:peptidase domain-containing ABC transporter n=1 Tax=Anaerocolumna aminovalerica TaxID=1527 RepID=UPI002915A8CF|nr:peptidase domain-containing ABC transporter [Anaerocolumna aminovalerica]MDU6264775.1 peptidase domain-containing ABC transporter [Anaerocolumna aminovalerica]